MNLAKARFSHHGQMSSRNIRTDYEQYKEDKGCKDDVFSKMVKVIITLPFLFWYMAYNRIVRMTFTMVATGTSPALHSHGYLE